MTARIYILGPVSISTLSINKVSKSTPICYCNRNAPLIRATLYGRHVTQFILYILIYVKNRHLMSSTSTDHNRLGSSVIV